MKKLLMILLAAALVLSLAACQSGEENPGASEKETVQGTGSENQTPPEDAFTFTYNGTTITLYAEAAPIIEALGEPLKYTESTSCAFEGLDKSYDYGSFHLETYPQGDQDFVYGWWFVDDLVETDEGICIGSSQADVEAAYGAENYNGSNAYIVKQGGGVLTVILENGVVTSVQYAIVTE